MMEVLNNFLNNDSTKIQKTEEKAESFSFREVAKSKSKAKNMALRKKVQAREEEEDEEEVEDTAAEYMGAKNATKISNPGLNPNTTARVKNPNPILEDWFMVGSKGFLDPN